MDPRAAIIDRRLAEVGRIVAVAGGKGGIGKSTVSATLALMLGRRMRVGLLDLDLTGPSDHVILGAPTGFPTEEYGVDPSQYAGIRFLSIAHFLGEAPAPLRGVDLTNATIELLAIARWGALDTLVIDMPPGLSDTTLDLMRYLPRAEFLIVATPSRVVLETVRRNLEFLTAQGVSIAGVVENMAKPSTSGTAVRELAARWQVPYLGGLPRDETLEATTGDAIELGKTPFAQAVEEVSRVFGRAR